MDAEVATPQKGAEKRSGFYVSVFNVVNTCIGLGVLKLPQAMDKAGWVGGLVMLCGSFIFSTFCMILLYNALVHNGVRVAHSFEEIGEILFGRPGKYAAFFMVYSTLFVVLVVILCLFGGALETLFSGANVNQRVWVLISSIVVLPLAWLPSMADVGILSALALLSIFFVVVVVIVGSLERRSDPEYRLMSRNFVDFTGSFCVYLLAFCCTSTTPNIVQDMKDPTQFPRVAIVSFASIFSVYAVISVIGYACFGSSLGNADTIINAISPNPHDPDTYASILQAGVIVLVASHYMINFTPFGAAADRLVVASGAQHRLWKYVLRSFIVVLTSCAAVSVPQGKVGPLLDLMAAVNFTSMTLVFPVLAFWQSLRLSGRKHPGFLRRLFESLILLVGLFGIVVGTWSGIKSIRENW